MLNEERIARASILDGIKFQFLFRGHDLFQQRYQTLINGIMESSGWEEQAVRAYVKAARIVSGKKDKTEIESYFIGGKLCRHIPETWTEGHITSIREVQVKVFFIEGEAKGYDALNNAIWNAKDGSFQPRWYGVASERARSEKGKRGFAFSTGKSDVHVTGNQYRGQRPGVETHCKGESLRKIVTHEADRRERELDTGTARKAFPEVQYQAALRGARRILRSLRSRGICITDYFVGVSHISWATPLHDRDYVVLDPDEEVSAIKYAKAKGFTRRDDGQLPLFESE